MLNTKRAVQLLVRDVHRLIARRELPEKIAIYFHSLEPGHHGQFAECIEFFQRNGYQCVTAQEFVQASHGKLLYLSFDDNFRNWYESLPLLRELNVKATFFLNTLPIRDLASRREIDEYYDRIRYEGERVPLSREEIRELSAAGHKVGCHSHSHVILSELPEARIQREILDSKSILEDSIGERVEDFSFPFGFRRHFNDHLKKYCLASGFATISNAIPGLQYGLQKADWICRSSWDLERDVAYNVENLCIDGRLFERVTGRASVI